MGRVEEKLKTKNVDFVACLVYCLSFHELYIEVRSVPTYISVVFSWWLRSLT